MAADELLLEIVGAEPSTVLRFYRWNRPTLSIGSSQPILATVDLDACRRLGVDIVRRPTGGQAVLHDHELTYAVASSHPDLLADPSPYGPYRRISAALAAALRELGIAAELAPRMRRPGALRTDPCFMEAGFSEIIYKGRKVAGSAQRRLRDRFLQHGSILERFDANLLASCTRSDADVLAGGVVSISEAIDGDPPALEAVFAEAFRKSFAVELVARPWSVAEQDRIERLVAEKHGAPAWIARH